MAPNRLAKHLYLRESLMIKPSLSPKLDQFLKPFGDKQTALRDALSCVLLQRFSELSGRDLFGKQFSKTRHELSHLLCFFTVSYTHLTLPTKA